MTAEILPILQIILAFGNVCILFYTLVKFLGKPHNSLDERITTLEVWKRDVDERLKHGNDKFREQDAANEIMIKSILALIEFEMEYCSRENKPVSTGLQKAKDDLHSYLAKK